jgi:hypothetical protein
MSSVIDGVEDSHSLRSSVAGMSSVTDGVEDFHSCDFVTVMYSVTDGVED